MAAAAARRNGMHMVGEAGTAVRAVPTSEERVAQLEAEVEELKATNATLVQNMDWMRGRLHLLERAAAVAAAAFSQAASQQSEPSALSAEQEQPG